MLRNNLKIQEEQQKPVINGRGVDKVHFRHAL